MVSRMSWESIQHLLQSPELLGHAVGFRDLTPLHGQWIREIVFGEEDYTLQAHRGSYKSSCLAVSLALFMIIQPRRNTIFLRKTDSDVSEMMGMVAKILRSDIMQDICRILYGCELEITAETTDHISTNLWTSPMGAPQLRGLGIRSSITGSHAWLVVTDDICNISDRTSHAERERTKIQYDELQNIRNRGGRIINIGTPWHKEDVFTRMPNIHRYDCYETGLITKEKLNHLRQSMTPSLFAANYELKHIADEDTLFDAAPQIVPFSPELLRDGWSHIDAAYGGSDYTAFTCVRYDGDTGNVYLFGKLWRRHVRELIPTIINLANELQCWPLYSENNGDKGFVHTEIRRAGYWAKEYHESQNKYIKISSYLTKWWPRIRIVEGTDPEYIDQILDYTIDAEHDDAPDSAASLCRIIDSKSWCV